MVHQLYVVIGDLEVWNDKKWFIYESYIKMFMRCTGASHGT